MPLDKSSDASINQSLLKYIVDGEVFFSSLTTGTNKWCLGIKAEDEKTAQQIEIYFCHWPLFKSPLYIKLSNKQAALWCNGKYNVVIVTQSTEEELLAIQKNCIPFISQNNE